MSKTKLSREEIAKIEIGHTAGTKPQMAALCVLFLGFIVIYPIFQFAYELRTRDIQNVVDLQPLMIFPLLAEAKMTEESGLVQGLLDFNRDLTGAIKKYENALEDTSALRAALLAPTQKWLVRQWQTGNEKAILGQDGWLFYSSDFNYLINPGFLRPERLKKRALSHVQPDPVKAIVDFHRQLRERGIELILLPVPVKPMLYGDKLGGVNGLVQNSSWGEFQQQMVAAGVRVVDVAPDLAAMRANADEPYLKTDTHWTPQAMALVAKCLARELGAPEREITGDFEQVTALGDIALMLKLADPSEVFAAETVRVLPQNFQPSRSGRILLLGDSFTNIYSVEAMNWGGRAGLAEQLMAELDEPIDVIARNDAGAYATRQLLANELKRGRDRLAGKEVVIYEFAIRELADGDWKMLDLTLGEAPEATFLVPEATMVVTGTVWAISEVPRPNSAPYKDHVMSLHLGDINGSSDQALVYMASMRDNVWTRAAQLRTGETVTIALRPWSEMEAEYGSWNRSDLDDVELTLQEPCWGEITR